MRRLLLVVALGVAGVALAQSVAPPMGTSGTLAGPITVTGPVTATGALSADGGVSAPTVEAGAVTITGALAVDGGVSFGQPPSGVVRSGTLTLGSSTSLSVGCTSLGTATVTGATTGGLAQVVAAPGTWPINAFMQAVVTSANTVTVKACSAVSLQSAPAGAYTINVVGP